MEALMQSEPVPGTTYERLCGRCKGEGCTSCRDRGYVRCRWPSRRQLELLPRNLPGTTSMQTRVTLEAVYQAVVQVCTCRNRGRCAACRAFRALVEGKPCTH